MATLNSMNKKKIHWMIPYNRPDETLIISANLASVRLRLGSVIQTINYNKYELNYGDNLTNEPDFIVIGKIGNLKPSQDSWLDQILQKKKSGSKILLDYTDNHLNFDSPLASFYNKILPHIDAAITSSSFLANKLGQEIKIPIEVIPDALEVPIFKPKIKASTFKNIFWFGHASNIIFLVEFINNLRGLEHKTTIFILTNENGLRVFNRSNLNIDKNLSIQIGIWSIESMINTAKFCDVVIIPSDPNDPRKSGVSSNRLITALALGLPVAADIMDSYKEFTKYFVKIRSEEFLGLLKHPNAFHSQILEAQEMIVPCFSKEVIGQKWVNFFDKLSEVY